MNKKLLSIAVLLSVCLHGVDAEARTLRMSNMAMTRSVENQLVEQVFIPYIERKLTDFVITWKFKLRK